MTPPPALLPPPAPALAPEVTTQLLSLTPARYISYLIHRGRTASSTQFCKKTEIESTTYAFIIACIGEGHITVEAMQEIKSIRPSTFTGCIKDGYITYTLTDQRAINHKPIRHYSLTKKGTRAWNRIRPHTLHLINKLKTNIHTA